MPSRRILAALILASVPLTLPGAVLARSPRSTPHRATAHPPLARVRYIQRGLTVRPPRHKQVKGKVKMPLENQFFLRTHGGQRASLGFQDQTTLHMNQRTDLFLRSPHVTEVKRGEIDQVVVPGTDHRIQTAAAAASAIGTNYDVRVAGKRSTFIVVDGAVMVRNRKGSVLVKTDHETTVQPNRAPSPPVPVDAKSAIRWTTGIPAPHLGENLALDANGGALVETTSDHDPGHAGALAHDGRLDTGWESASGRVNGQFIRFLLPGTASYMLSGVVIDPAATGAASPQTDLRDFEVRLATSCPNPDSCTKGILRGTAQQKDALQIFKFDRPVQARYVELWAASNYGGDAVSVAEFEVIGTPPNTPLLWHPQGVAVDGRGNIDISDTFNNRLQQITDKGATLRTWGEQGSGPGQVNGPSGLTVDAANNVYVADPGNHRIDKFSATGQYIASFTGGGSGQKPLGGPTAVALDQAGNLYVTDPQTGRIVVLSPSGQQIRQWSGAGGTKQLNGANGIAVDTQGDVYVAETAGRRIDKFTATGQLLTQWGSSGTGPGQFGELFGLALDAQGNVYSADHNNATIQKFSPTGQPLALWGGHGGDSPLTGPFGVAVDRQGNVLVADADANRIVKLSPSGQLLAHWGMRGP